MSPQAANSQAQVVRRGTNSRRLLLARVITRLAALKSVVAAAVIAATLALAPSTATSRPPDGSAAYALPLGERGPPTFDYAARTIYNADDSVSRGASARPAVRATITYATAGPHANRGGARTMTGWQVQVPDGDLYCLSDASVAAKTVDDILPAPLGSTGCYVEPRSVSYSAIVLSNTSTGEPPQ